MCQALFGGPWLRLLAQPCTSSVVTRSSINKFKYDYIFVASYNSFNSGVETWRAELAAELNTAGD